MNIKKYVMFKLNQRYYPLNTEEQNIIYLSRFIQDGFPFINRRGITEYITKLETIYGNAINFESVSLNIDQSKDIIYLSEPYFEYAERAEIHEIEELMDNISTLELCQHQFIKYMIISKENFMHLLFALNQQMQQDFPFALLYQNDKNWYDVLPFDSQEAMEKFIADHTQQEIV